MNPARPAVLLDTPQGSIPLRYSIERIPDAPDPQVAATIARMNDYVLADYKTPYIRSDAQTAVALDPTNPLGAVHHFVRSRMEFCRDEKIAKPFEHLLPPGGYFAEAITRPIDVSLQYAATGQRVKGDCDCHSGYCAALLKALDIDCCYATISDDDDPTVFSHIYVVAYWRGMRVPLDCSHGDYVGWEKQRSPRDRYQEWGVHDRASWGALGVGMVLAGLAFYRWQKNGSVF